MAETCSKQFTPTASALISLLGCALFGAEEPAQVCDDPNSVLEEAEKQAVFPVVYQYLSQRLPGSLDPKWNVRFLKHLSNNINVISQHYHAHKLMSEAGVPYMVIKGCASGHYYSVPELRTMGDVDLFVEKSAMETVRSFLTEKGYEVSSLNHSHHWTFTKDREIFEVHWLPSGVPAEDNGKIKVLFDDMLSKRVLVNTGGNELYLPDAYHHGLILLLHTANHLSAGGIGLRHLLDWLVFVASMPEQEFLERFEAVLKQIGLWQFAKVLTAVGVWYFSCDPKAFCGDVSRELAGGILLDIINGGNFGIKDSNRLMESKLLRDEKTRAIDGKSRFRHIIRFLNRKAQLAFPISEKCPVLLPLGWVIVGRNHYKFRKSIHAKPVKLRGLARSAREREQLYQQLRLFEE